jgi:hypothetical protein
MDRYWKLLMGMQSHLVAEFACEIANSGGIILTSFFSLAAKFFSCFEHLGL